MLAELELTRWKYHMNEYLPKAKEILKENTRVKTWWEEHGAFTCILPRQTGKTLGFIKGILHELEDEQTVVIASSLNIAMRMQKDKGIVAKNTQYVKDAIFDGTLEPANVHLVFDEFQLISREDIKTLLEFKWKSVTFVGTLLF